MEINAILKEAINSTKNDFLEILSQAAKILEKEEKIIHLPKAGELLAIGDLHGDLDSLSKILKEFWKPENYLLFLGDYGDRGSFGPEVYFSLLKLKIKFKERIFLLRGNHEGPGMFKPFPHELPWQLFQKYEGLYLKAVTSRYKKDEKPYHQLKKLWEHLPIAALTQNKQCLFLHGGLPENLDSVENLKKNEFLEEILWSDPAERIKNALPSPRGAGKLFGGNITKKVLEKIGARILIRSHEPIEGFKINHRGRVLTIFSTRMPPPYQNQKRAVLKINLERKVKDAFSLLPNLIIF